MVVRAPMGVFMRPGKSSSKGLANCATSISGVGISATSAIQDLPTIVFGWVDTARTGEFSIEKDPTRSLAAIWLVGVLTLGFRRSIKKLCDSILKFCQFPPQPTNVQKTSCYFTEVSAHQFVDVAAPAALTTLPKYVSNRLFGGAKPLSDLVIVQTTCDEEQRLELHRLQEVCQRRREGV